MISTNTIAFIVILLIILLVIYTHVDAMRESSEFARSYGYTIVEKDISMHSIERPYKSKNGKIAVIMILRKGRHCYEAYYTNTYNKSLYVSKYTLKNKEQYLLQARNSSPGSKEHFIEYNKEFKTKKADN